MNVVKEIQRINERQLEQGGSSSWHDQYKDSAYVYVGGLDLDLTEGDVITVFSQYGEVADINMPRDKQTNKPRGFAFLMYEDQRSTVLAVDNLNGAKLLERTLRVDHVNNYKQLEKGEDGKYKEREQQSLNALPELFMQRDEDDSASDASSHPSIDPDDPMAAYLLEQRRAGKGGKAGKGRPGETKEERKARRARKREKKRLRAEIKASYRDEEAQAGRDRDRDRDRARRGEDDDEGRRAERRRDDSPPPRRAREDDRRARTRSRSPPPAARRRRSPSPVDDGDRTRRRRDRSRSRSPRARARRD